MARRTEQRRCHAGARAWVLQRCGRCRVREHGHARSCVPAAARRAYVRPWGALGSARPVVWRSLPGGCPRAGRKRPTWTTRSLEPRAPTRQAHAWPRGAARRGVVALITRSGCRSWPERRCFPSPSASSTNDHRWLLVCYGRNFMSECIGSQRSRLSILRLVAWLLLMVISTDLIGNADCDVRTPKSRVTTLQGPVAPSETADPCALFCVPDCFCCSISLPTGPALDLPTPAFATAVEYSAEERRPAGVRPVADRPPLPRA